MKVRTKFAVLMLVVTFALSGVVYGQLEFSKQRSVSQMQESVDQTAARTAKGIGAEVRQQKDYVGFYASRPGASNFSNSTQYLQRFLTNPHLYAAQLIAANGTVVDFRGDVTAEVRRATIGSDLSNRTYVQRTVGTGSIHVTDPEYVNATDQYIVIISAPVFEDGEIVGVLAAAVPINEFTILTMVESLETDTRTVSVRADGKVLYEPESSFSNPVSSTATVASTGWTVRIERDRARLAAQLREMAIMQAASLALVLLLVVGLSVWEYNANIRQAEKLLDGFSALRDGDYDHSVGLSSGEEWHQIREGFDDLADALAERENVLREREQRLQVFNRVLRHNLRNDMTVVVNYAEFVAEQTEDTDIRDAAEKIASHGWNLVDLSEKAQRIESTMEDRDPRPTALDAAAIAEEAAATVRSEWPDADVSVEASDDTVARAVPVFDAAVENVCENAVVHNDAAEPELTISVETTTDDGEEWVRVAVADNGPGLPEEERTVLTEGVETDLDHGSGLGLWLVHWVVERSDGRLSFAENDPRGTVVRMDLRPADDADD